MGAAYDTNKRKIFKGEYINDKKWKGTEFTYQKNLKFEKEYKNGEKIGKIIMKEYFKNNLLFEGESLNGKRNGKGKEYLKNELVIFEGDYLHGKRNGYGIEYNVNGGKFIGKFKNGKKWDGTGYNKNNEIDYEIIEGFGVIKEYYSGKLIYEGEYSKGERHGYGKEYDFLTGKLKYKGRFYFGKKLNKAYN